LPKIMCGECTYKLDLISNFRETAYKTETELLSQVDVNLVKAEVINVFFFKARVANFFPINNSNSKI
jgi:hypothetical protein